MKQVKLLSNPKDTDIPLDKAKATKNQEWLIYNFR